MPDFVYAKDINNSQTTLNALKVAGNIPATIPVVATVYAGNPISGADYEKLVQAINILESNFSNNCNCKAGTTKCQSCQSVPVACQSCQACQTSKCQSCQTQFNCNCNCSDGSDS